MCQLIFISPISFALNPTKKLDSPVASGCKKNPWYYRGSGLLTNRWSGCESWAQPNPVVSRTQLISQQR